MRRNQFVAVCASLFAAVGGLSLTSSRLSADEAASEETCVYAYAATCDDELCGPGYVLTCSPCTIPLCEDRVAYSCCYGGGS